MDILNAAKVALAMMQEGRQQLNAIVDAVRDGREALSTTDIGELNRLLAQEKIETQAAHNTLDRAIQAAKSK